MLLRSTNNRTHGKLLSQILPSAQLMGGKDVVLASCTCEVEAVRAGDVFIAFDAEGEGHDASLRAIERGAVAIVCERYLPVFGASQYVVESSRAAYSELCHALLDFPCDNLNAIAVAGSYGKTSVAQLLESILLAAGKPVACQTNQYTRIDGCPTRFVLPTTAPGIAEFVDESLAAGCRHAVVELSENTLRRKVASAAAFDVVCLTNLHGDQVSDGRSPEARCQSMASALDLLSPGGMALFCADDQKSMRLLAEYEGPTLTFGMHHPAEVTGLVVEQHVNEQTFLLTLGGDTVAIQTSIIGEAHVQNCLAAATIAHVYGVSIQDIAVGLGQVKVVPGVMHRFDAGLGFSIFLDRGQAAVAKGAVLKAVRQATNGRVIAVVDAPCAVTDALADCTIATGRLSKGAMVTNAVAEVLASLEVTDSTILRRVTAKLTGIGLALLRAQEGDVVVVCGFGDSLSPEKQPTQSLQEQRLVQELLKELVTRLPSRSAA